MTDALRELAALEANDSFVARHIAPTEAEIAAMLKAVAQRTEPRRRQGDLMPYAIEVVAVDHVGIVHEITQFFSQRDIGVEDMYSGSYAAAHTATPMFSLHMTISVPTNVSIAGLRGEFMDFCDHLNLDAIMEPVK